MLLNKKISVWYFIREIKSQILFIGIFAVAIGLLDMLPWFRKISLTIEYSCTFGNSSIIAAGFQNFSIL
jgi:putative membrane protein